MSYTSRVLRPAVVPILSLALALLLGCGTYSILRPPDTIDPGSAELNAGLAVNSIGEVIPVAQGAIGLADRIELVGQWEVYNAFAELRGQILDSDEHGVGLTVGAGGGVGFTALELVSDELEDVQNEGAATVSAVIGRKMKRLDLYLGNRTMWLVPSYLVNTTKAGVRLKAGPYFRLILEGGMTIHHGWLVLGEGTLAIGLGW